MRFVLGHRKGGYTTIRELWDHLIEPKICVDGDCWVQSSNIDTMGYGQVSLKGGRKLKSHRVSYEIHHGPIPHGLGVLHSCDRPGCVNPAHLSVGTQADNAHDMVSRGRSSRGERHAAIFTEEDVRRMRDLHDGGMTPTQISRLYSANNNTVRNILFRLNWKWVA